MLPPGSWDLLYGLMVGAGITGTILGPAAGLIPITIAAMVIAGIGFATLCIQLHYHDRDQARRFDQRLSELARWQSVSARQPLCGQCPYHCVAEDAPRRNQQDARPDPPAQ